ncbi:MAG: PqiC family protein [Candidatus Accumulibacter sp.]|jgi:cholesterol transport system auxiliary component|nr:PqiC family protein [Accumulibacter sp.]
MSTGLEKTDERGGHGGKTRPAWRKIARPRGDGAGRSGREQPDRRQGKRAALALAVFLLAGCASLERNEKPAAIYDFGQPAFSSVENAAAAGRLALEVRAAPWLDGPGIDYRLTYSDPLRRNQYIDSLWAAPPALLLAQRLRRRIGFSAVDSVAADCVLRIELLEFSHVFTAPRISQGVLQGQISLIDGKRRLLAGRAIAIERPAPDSDAAGGVQALVEASEELGRQLAGWLERLEREGGLKACASGY